MNRVNRVNLRLGVLGARGLATRFAAASHFEIVFLWKLTRKNSEGWTRREVNVGIIIAQRG